MTLRKEDIELINKLSHQASADDSGSIDDIIQYKRILEASSNWKVGSKRDIDFSNVAERIQKSNINTPAKSEKLIWLAAASISALILICTWLLHFNQMEVINVPVAQIKTIWLPDSSKVVLNANSELSYSRDQWKNKNRTVTLAGIAYFEVKKGSRFVVETVHGDVAVLGTSFNVKAVGTDFVVECISGRVSVKGIEEIEAIELTPGLKIEKDEKSGSLLPSSFDPKSGKEWVDGTFNFRNQPLEKVWDEFERQFDVEINYDNVEPRFYTGTFRNEDMTQALITICKPMGLRFQIDEDKKILTINN